MGKHRDPFETKMLLLEYLASLETRTPETVLARRSAMTHRSKIRGGREGISLTRASQVMFKNHRDTSKIVIEMQKERLVDVEWSNNGPAHWLRGLVTITPRGLEIGQKIRVLTSMLTVATKKNPVQSLDSS